ncbi:MAG: DUF4349 domain-containing protein [Ginsengibacter sp.]
MKTTTKLFAAIGLITLFFACNQSSTQDSTSAKAENEMMMDSTANEFISSSAAVENGKDSTRKFIRTAELKFKVKSVVNATYAIENITNQFGGFVAFTELNSNIDNTTTTTVSADSSLETTYFTVANTMTLRVPNTQLDTTLKSIATFIDFLDYRIIKADDVALNLLANKLTQDRTKKTEKRLTTAIDNRGKKLKETTAAEELLSGKQEQSDNAKISNLSLQDQVNFSTITLSIYQRQAIKRELTSNNKNIDEYTPGFGSRIVDSFKSGWEILQNIIIFIAQMWGLILVAVVVYFLYRRFGHKLKK